MFNFWTFVFRGRLRRLERAHQAAALLAEGKLDEAADRLEMAKSPGFGQDVGVYHFVKARLHMAKAEWELADIHLQTALGLGLTRPSVDLCVGLVKARLRQPDAALEALDRIGVEGSDDVQEQAAAVKEQLATIFSGQALADLQEEVERITAVLSLSLKDDPDSLVSQLTDLVIKEQVDRDQAILLLGSLAVIHRSGAWVLGLEPVDHAVAVGGRTFLPRDEVDRVASKGGRLGPKWVWE